jgi:ligand-binding sensor protein
LTKKRSNFEKNSKKIGSPKPKTEKFRCTASTGIEKQKKGGRKSLAGKKVVYFCHFQKFDFFNRDNPF